MNSNNRLSLYVNRLKAISSERLRLSVVTILLAVSIISLFVSKSCEFDRLGSIVKVVGTNNHDIPKPVTAYFVNREFNETLSDSERVVSSSDTFNVELSIYPMLQKKLHQLLVRYHPRCGAVVVMRPATGEVLAAVSYRNEKEENFLPESINMLFWNEYPAASLFKIVTTAGVLEYRLMNAGDGINVTGNLWTLYKHQLQQDKPNRWSRFISMREAFTRSINPFFGKVGMYVLGADRMNVTAGKFLFNYPIAFDLPLGESRYVPPINGYEAAALASGFNRFTTITPIHAAMMAGAVANKGNVSNPKLIRSIRKDNKVLYVGGCDTMYNLIRSETARETMNVMGEVVRRGTARKGFAHILRGDGMSGIQMGGKTGNLNSDNPKGRCDWFAGFAIDSRNPENSISVAVVTVHGPYWNVHSSYLGAEAIQTYFKNFR
jgi:cell division protein FtsI/penicillin-binding protein 2